MLIDIVPYEKYHIRNIYITRIEQGFNHMSKELASKGMLMFQMAKIQRLQS
jgi:hypothetical protein